MQPIHVALLIIGILVVICVATTFVTADRTSDTVPTMFAFGAAVCIVLFLIVGWMALGPEYRLWRASVEKRILVEEARAQADAAIELARAEVERAEGTAAANLIVADSITEPYLRYLYINGLTDTSNQVIYLPTEAGLPILEADRFRQENGEVDQ